MHQRRLSPTLRRAIFCALLVATPAPSVLADEALGRHVGIILERLQGERRLVLAYLAHGNTDLALTALDRWRATLRTEGAKLLTSAPGRSELRPVLEALDRSLDEAAKAADRSDTARASELVQVATVDLDAWRRAGGLRLFSDCIAELASRYVALDRYRPGSSSLDDPADRAEIEAAASRVAATVNRCNAEAGQAVRSDPEFRRLADGMSASLAKVPSAVAARDAALLHRLLIELRAFERLLAFRYG
ncbi:hypothetical protein [Methylorubrum extorquens]|nr:hypothetical protein [Methylorubrum extorquens]